MRYFILFFLVSFSAHAEDNRCVKWDGSPISFREYFKYDTGIDPNFTHNGEWDHEYGETFTRALDRLSNAIADYQTCLAKHLLGKEDKK